MLSRLSSSKTTTSKHACDIPQQGYFSVYGYAAQIADTRSTASNATMLINSKQLMEQ